MHHQLVEVSSKSVDPTSPKIGHLPPPKAVITENLFSQAVITENLFSQAVITENLFSQAVITE